MKTTKFYFIYVIVTFLVICITSVQISAESTNSNRWANTAPQSPETVIKSFYKWYINTVEAGDDPFQEGRPTLEKYVTLRLISQIEKAESDGSDADPFLQTQEWDAAWANDATISKLNIKSVAATAIVTFDLETNYPRVLITLVKQAGAWKIDKVKNAPQQNLSD